MIKLDQINSLIKLSQAKGSNAGFVLNFRNDKEGEPYSLNLKSSSILKVFILVFLISVSFTMKQIRKVFLN